MTYTINTRFQSIAYNQRVRFLVLHYTAVDFDTSMRLLLGNDPNHQVSAHYLVAAEPREDGIIYQLVDENKRAWHSGLSDWRGHTNINDSSIGIELVNPDGNKHEFPGEQVQALVYLCNDILERHEIEPNNVVGHSDISPGRKIDPGLLFPWERLYDNGIGPWPDEEDVSSFLNIPSPDIQTLAAKLRAWGYEIPPKANEEEVNIALNAFRRHFCPRYLGLPIDAQTHATLLALLKKYGGAAAPGFMHSP